MNAVSELSDRFELEDVCCFERHLENRKPLNITHQKNKWIRIVYIFDRITRDVWGELPIGMQKIEF